MSFLIRKSMGRSLFAAHHGLSQLIASFFGVWCLGIHPVLLLAWFFRRLILRPTGQLCMWVFSSLFLRKSSLLRCNWSFFRIILCAVVKVQAASLRFVLISTFRFHLNGSLGNCSVFAFANPENDTELNLRKRNRFPLWRCASFADSSFPSSAADFCQPCCPVTAPYWSTCFAFASLVNQIDL